MFNQLHIYTVHVLPGQALGAMPLPFSFRNFFTSLRQLPSPIFVREGFNIWAFLFTMFWTAYHRLWMATGLIITINVVFTLLEKYEYITLDSSYVLLIGLQIFVGFYANDWMRAKLKKRGYITTAIVTGDNQMRAEQRFFENYLDPAVPAPSM